ncbi:ADP-ribosylation factor [Histomonas meleagridis]|uniref:ADP-ribosylation factor n=1 Tax=Histomonas meleagridis TaxID=135588 RepID=UPI0035593A6C|nr:ADP-ribosylation factor [Histomonas meleagridis]KAH0799140.1 ADP-ribosylation factor [Histomonas meleagridis]
MVGVRASGKTVILNRIKLNEFKQSIHTMNFNIENITFKGLDVDVWDIGDSGDRIRPLWCHFYYNADGFIYVVDSSDIVNINESRYVLSESVLEKIEIPNPIMLVYANKQDLPNSHTPSEIGESLQLGNVPNLTWKVQGASAKTGDGIFEGFEWLIEQIKARGFIYDF